MLTTLEAAHHQLLQGYLRFARLLCDFWASKDFLCSSSTSLWSSIIFLTGHSREGKDSDLLLLQVKDGGKRAQLSTQEEFKTNTTANQMHQEKIMMSLCCPSLYKVSCYMPTSDLVWLESLCSPNWESLIGVLAFRELRSACFLSSCTCSSVRRQHIECDVSQRHEKCSIRPVVLTRDPFWVVCLDNQVLQGLHFTVQVCPVQIWHRKTNFTAQLRILKWLFQRWANIALILTGCITTSLTGCCLQVPRCDQFCNHLFKYIL